jgi:hypothetical protein
MFTHDTQIYASLRIPAHVTQVTHDYSDLLMLHNEYARITRELRIDNAVITHLVLSFAHCYALIRINTHVTQCYAELRRFTHDTQVNACLRNLTHVTHVTHDYADLRMLRNEYAMNTQCLRNDYTMITQFLRI